MRIRSWTLVALVVAVIFAVSWKLASQESAPGGIVIRPPSSVEKPGDVGVRGHSNVEIFLPKNAPNVGPPPKEFYNPENTVPKPERDPNCPSSQPQNPPC